MCSNIITSLSLVYVLTIRLHTNVIFADIFVIANNITLTVSNAKCNSSRILHLLGGILLVHLAEHTRAACAQVHEKTKL